MGSTGSVLDKNAIAKLVNQSFVGTLQGSSSLTYHIGAVLPQPPPFVVEKRREFGIDEAVLCFTHASCTLPAMEIKNEAMYAAIDVKDGVVRVFLLSPTRPELGYVVLALEETSMTLTGGDETWWLGQKPIIEVVLESRAGLPKPPAPEPKPQEAASQKASPSNAPSAAAAASGRASSLGLRRGDAFAGGETHPFMGEVPVTLSIGDAVDAPSRDYGAELAKHRATVVCEAVWSAQENIKRANTSKFYLALCEPTEDQDRHAHALLLLAHERKNCQQATLRGDTITGAKGRFKLARAS